MHISIKMAGIETMSPSAIMGNFANKYETCIIPGLKDGNILAVRGVIGSCCVCSASFQGMSNKQFEGYRRYGFALGHLRLLLEGEPGKMSPGALERRIQSTLLLVSRQVAELNFVMKEDRVYEKYRQGSEI